MPTLATCESDLITVSSSACSPFADLSSLITRAIRKDPQHPDKSRIDTNRIANYQVYQQTKERHDNNEKVKLVPRVIEVVAAQNIQLEKCLDSKNASKNVIQHGHHLCHAFRLVVVLNTHGKSVQNDRPSNEMIEGVGLDAFHYRFCSKRFCCWTTF